MGDVVAVQHVVGVPLSGPVRPQPHRPETLGQAIVVDQPKHELPQWADWIVSQRRRRPIGDGRRKRAALRGGRFGHRRVERPFGVIDAHRRVDVDPRIEVLLEPDVVTRLPVYELPHAYGPFVTNRRHTGVLNGQSQRPRKLEPVRHVHERQNAIHARGDHDGEHQKCGDRRSDDPARKDEHPGRDAQQSDRRLALVDTQFE